MLGKRCLFSMSGWTSVDSGGSGALRLVQL